jgi:acyl-CoA thioester hydrolase
MASEFRMEHRVEFADTDMAGIMHFANFFRFMERTEHAFLRSFGFSVHQRLGERTIGWPRVHVHCDYRKPLRFEDDFEIHLLVREKREKSLTYEFIFRRGTEEVARGGFTTVCATWDESSRSLKATPIPAELADQIEAAGPKG